MSILSEVNTLLGNTGIPIETGSFKGKAPDEYMVLTPLNDTFTLFGDNRPGFEVQELRLSLFSKNNYISRKNQLVRLLLQADFVITDRRYIGHEDDTGYHHYTIDVAKEYLMEEE